MGTRADAREAERARQGTTAKAYDPMEAIEEQGPSIGPAHAEVL
jgi:hypothetical protein